MPKYFDFKVGGYYLYFTSHCIEEPIHTHANDKRLNESGSGKLWLMEDGQTQIVNQGTVSKKDMKKIQKFIKLNIETMKDTWEGFSGSITIKNNGKNSYPEEKEINIL